MTLKSEEGAAVRKVGKADPLHRQQWEEVVGTEIQLVLILLV